MNGYECPCCDCLITIADSFVRRDCPGCKATAETQSLVRRIRSDRAWRKMMAKVGGVA